MTANVNQITTDLRMMGDKQLQQYAAMHKNDPFIFPLAFQESQTRQHMRSAQQAQMGGQPQPKVVDQDLAQMAPPAPQPMLPEDQGIGQLPAQNLTKMAGGGIVAFDEGGAVAPQMFNQLPAGSFGAPQAGSADSQPWMQRKLDQLAAKVRSGTATPQEKAWVSMFGGDALARVGARETQASYQNAPDQLGGESARLAAQAKPITPPASGAQGAGIAAVAPEQTSVAPAATPTGAGIGGGFEQRFMNMVNKGEVSKEDRLKEITDIDKPVLEKMQATIDEQKGKLKTEGEQNFYMSLIKGGLAAAAGTGPNALQNIAQGFEKGATNYSEGLKDLRKAAQENSKMELAMSQYEASGKKDALKAYYDHQDKKQGYTAAGLASIYGHEISAAGQIGAAGAGANAQLGMLEKLGAAPEGSNLLKGLERKTQEDKIPRLYAEYTKMLSDPMKGEDFMRKYPNFQTYMAGMGGAGAGQFIQMPANAAPSTAVLPRKN